MMCMSKRARGSISVLLCLVLLPMITYSTMIIDATRLHSVRSNISGAGELTLNAMMSEYDKMLQEMFGLFANLSLGKRDENGNLIKDEDIQRALQTYFQQTVEGRFLPEVGTDGEFVQNTINGLVDKSMHATTHADDDELTDFLKVQLESFSADPVTASALANPNTMKRQILEYMKFRGPVSIFSTIFGKLDYLKDSGSQAEACDNKIEYTKTLGSLQEPCLAAYDAIEQEYNTGAMMINELVGEGLEKSGGDHLAEMIADSKEQYKKATAFYILNAQSPFYNTKSGEGNYYNFDELGKRYMDNAENGVSDDEKNAINNNYYDLVDPAKYPNLNSDDYNERLYARVEAMERLIKAAEDTGLYQDAGGGNQKFNQDFDVIQSNIKSTDRYYNQSNNYDSKLSGYGYDGYGYSINPAKSGAYPNKSKVENDEAELRKVFRDLPGKVETDTNTFNTQLNKAKAIFQAQVDLEYTYKDQIAQYSYNYKKLSAIYSQLDEIWKTIKRDAVDKFNASVRSDLGKINDHNRLESERVTKYNKLVEEYNKKTPEQWAEEYKNQLDELKDPENPRTEIDSPPDLFTEPPKLEDRTWHVPENSEFDYETAIERRDYGPEVQYLGFDYNKAWNEFFSDYDDGKLGEVDKQHVAMGRIVAAMESYKDAIKQYLEDAMLYNSKYYIDYADYYNENGYSAIAGVGMTLKMMQDGLETANGKLDEILTIINKKDGLKDKQNQWEESIVGSSTQKGVNSDSQKAAMLSDFNTLKDQFNEKEVKALKTVIVGEKGDGGLLAQVKSMLNDIQGIKYLDQNLFSLGKASSNFADAMADEVENKIKERFSFKEGSKMIDFFNIAKSPILQKFNKSAWEKICGDPDIPMFPSFTRGGYPAEKSSNPVPYFLETKIFDPETKTTKLDDVVTIAKEMVEDEKKFDTSSLYDGGSYKKEISHFRILDGIDDSVACAYSYEDMDTVKIDELKKNNSSVLAEDEKFMVTLYAEAKAAKVAAENQAKEDEKKAKGETPPEDNLKSASKSQIDESKKDPTDKRDPKSLAKENYGKLMSDIESYCNDNKTNKVQEIPDIGNADPKEKNDGGGLNAAKKLLGGLATLGETVVENMYLEEYFTEMFTCRTDNQMLNALTSDADKDVLPVIMLNGYHNQAALNVNPDKHLLNTATEWYGKEIEYLLWGNSDLNKNLGYTDAMIFAIRFALNAIYCFLAPDIQSYALELATAIAGWTVVGVPIVQVCITILIALAESGYDLYLLHDGRDVPIYKSQTTFVCSPTGMLRTVAEEGFKKITDDAIKTVTNKVEQELDNAIDSLGDKIVSAGTDRINGLKDTLTEYKNQQVGSIKSAIQKQFVQPIMNQVTPLASLLDIGQLYSYGNPKDMIAGAVDKALAVIESNITSDSMNGGVVKDICQELWATNKEIIKKEANEKLYDYFDSIYDFDKNNGPAAKVLNLEDQLNAYLEGFMTPFNKRINDTVNAAADKLEKTLKETKEITVDNAKTFIHDKMDAATAEIQGKVKNAGDKVLEKLPESDPSKIDTDAESGVTLNYKEYCKIFMLLFLSFGNQDVMLQRAAVLITCNMRHAVTKDDAGNIVQIGQDKYMDFQMTDAYTLFSVNARVKMMTLFPWPVKDVQDETSTEAGLQLDLQNIRSSCMSINYCGVNGY